jgi:alpha-tubulin suppressor-like RCC1 family protein
MYVEASRGPHSRVMQRAISFTNAAGAVVTRTNSYTELATGLSRLIGNQYVPCSDEILVTANGAAGTNCQHQSFFNSDFGSSSVIDLVTPEGFHMTSGVAALVYFDGVTNVVIATPQDSIGQLLPSLNQVIYTNAFTSASCDVIYTHTLAGFSQDVVVRQDLPLPASFGLTGSNIWLQVWTEFSSCPTPNISEQGDGDEYLNFGEMGMAKGRAVMVGTNAPSAKIFKQWYTDSQSGRKFLIESVLLNAIEPQLEQLPGGGSSGSGSGGGQSRLSRPHPMMAANGRPRQRSKPMNLPARKLARKNTATMRLAKSALVQKGLVLDYDILNGSLSGHVFPSDGTTFITNVVNISGTATFERGTVVKYAANANATIIASNAVWNTSSYGNACFTGMDDDTVGEQITGSSGNPATNYYGFIALNLEDAASPVISNARFSFLSAAIAANNVSLRDVQVNQCQTFMAGDSQGYDLGLFFNMYNVLACNVGDFIGWEGNDEGQTIICENVTVHRCNNFLEDPTSYLGLTNCLFVCVTNMYISSGYNETNHCAILSSDSGIFQGAGAGAHYLVTNTFQGLGTTNIDAALLAELRQKTTYPPQWLTNAITTNRVVGPQALRENAAAPDYGYAYDPIDWVAACAVSNATLTLTNGVALVYYSNPGILLQSGSQLVSQGSPIQPNRLVYYTMVQEQSSNLWSGVSSSEAVQEALAISPQADVATAPSASLDFTTMDIQAGAAQIWYGDGDWAMSSISLKNCEIYAGGGWWTAFASPHNPAFLFQNNLFHRAHFDIEGAAQISLYNNLFFGDTNGSSPYVLGFTSAPGTNRNNAFDGCVVSLGSTNIGWNAYLNGATWYTLKSNDVVTNITWVAGPLGHYYQPATNSPLINKGSTNADVLGLYHYTVETNEIPEGTNIVSVGYHYMALGTNGLPIDANHDFVPDYVENPDGPPPVFTAVVAWGDNSYGQCNVPPGLSNAVSVAGGLGFSVALRSDGTVIAWGDNTFGQTNVPSSATNVVAIFANDFSTLALRGDGSLVHWGESSSLPPTNVNFIMASQGDGYVLGLQSDGTVAAWGISFVTNLPAGLSNVTAVAAAGNFAVAQMNDGTITVWGTNFPAGVLHPPADLTNGTATVTAIAAAYDHGMALRSDGTVEAWGYDAEGQTNVPAGLSNVVTIAAGEDQSLALKQDGSVAVWGAFDDFAVFVPQGLDRVIAIGAGGNHCLAIRSALLPPVIAQEPAPANVVQIAGASVTFQVGIDGIGVSYQWQFDGTNIAGATNSALALTNIQAGEAGVYQVVASNGGGSITTSSATLNVVGPPQIVSTVPALPGFAWFPNMINVTNPGAGLTINATNFATDVFPLSYQWQRNGTNIAGATTSSYFTSTEADYTATVTDAAGFTNVGPWRVRFMQPGMVAAWGDDGANQLERPVTLTNAISVGAGSDFAAAVQDNGTVVAWGADDLGQTNIPGDLTNVTAIATGDYHGLALISDRTVRAWGLDDVGQTDVPTGLSNAVAVAAGGDLSMALLSNGTITNWGDIGTITNPVSLTNVMAIAVGGDFFLALGNNGMVTAWGDDSHHQTDVPSGLSNVVAIAAGGSHAMALTTDGEVIAWGDNTYGQTDVPAGLSNVMAIAAGASHNVALKNDGSVVAWGDNTYGQTNVIAGLTNLAVKLIAAGGNSSFASVFSSTVEYSVNVPNDLLLIYNTNSVDSTNVWWYYVQHRPMIAKANVLGVGCTTNETVTPGDLTNQILAPLQLWLAGNPTKRPQYLILFQEIPIRVNDIVLASNSYAPTDGHPDVGVQIRSLSPSWLPFVNYINLASTNDARAYIDKVSYFATNYSPGKLVISASAGGYGDANYEIDDVHDGGTNNAPTYVSQLPLILADDGVAASNIDYATDEFPPPDAHIYSATNVATYYCWGGHAVFLGPYPPFFNVNGTVQFYGQSSWYVMTTLESYNGRLADTGLSCFGRWFSANSFSGTNYNYLNTPVGAAANADECGCDPDPKILFGLWAQGKNLAICTWNSMPSQLPSHPYAVAVGDPFTRR